MSGYEKVLIVTDLSENANRAIGHGYALMPGGGQAHLLHVVEHESVPGPLYSHYTPDDLAQPGKRTAMEDSLKKKLRNLVPDAHNGNAVGTEVAVVFHPHIATAIVEEARARGVQAIVMGTHGRKGLAHLLLGSVTEDVIRHAGLPVLLVPME